MKDAIHYRILRCQTGYATKAENTVRNKTDRRKAKLNKTFVQDVGWKNTATDSTKQTTKAPWQTKILEQPERIRDETDFTLHSISANEEEKEEEEGGGGENKNNHKRKIRTSKNLNVVITVVKETETLLTSDAVWIRFLHWISATASTILEAFESQQVTWHAWFPSYLPSHTYTHIACNGQPRLPLHSLCFRVAEKCIQFSLFMQELVCCSPCTMRQGTKLNLGLGRCLDSWLVV